MTTTTNLELVHMEALQDDKDVVVNAALDGMDGSIAGMLTHNMTSDADYTINKTTDEHLNLVLQITDSGANLSANRNIIVPDLGHMYVAWNNTGGGFSLVFKTASGTGITVADGEKKLVYSDATNVQFVSGLQSLEYPVDISLFKAVKPTNAELIFVYVCVRQTEFPASLTGSKGVANVAANASATFDFKKNGGTAFATANFAAAATVATFTAASSTTFNVGDILTVIAPATADTTLSDIGFTLKVSNLAV